MSRLFLAPMEGLADYVLRDVLTDTRGYDGCVSEFVRVTGSLLPARVYERDTPEILAGGYTRGGTPMVIQLLGSDPEWLARNAAYAATLSPHGIDLNFGCPAKVVNRHGGGAMLLTNPELLNRIVASVRAAVPAHIAVTAKCGWASPIPRWPLIAPRRWPRAARLRSSCMPGRGTMATGRRLTGTGSRALRLRWTCPSLLTETSGQSPTGSVAGPSAVAPT